MITIRELDERGTSSSSLSYLGVLNEMCCDKALFFSVMNNFVQKDRKDASSHL